MPKKSNLYTAIVLIFLSLNGTLLCMNNAKKPLSEKELLINGVVVLQHLPAPLQSLSLGYYGPRGATKEPLSAFRTTRRKSLLNTLSCRETSLITFQEDPKNNNNWQITALTTYLKKGLPQEVFTSYTLDRKFGKIAEVSTSKKTPFAQTRSAQERDTLALSANPSIVACLLPHKKSSKPAQIGIFQNDQHALALALKEAR